MKSIPVYILLVEHRHGRNLTVHSTEQERLNEAYDYVKEWWSEEFADPPPIPDDKQVAVEMYFQEQAENSPVPESYEYFDESVEQGAKCTP